MKIITLNLSSNVIKYAATGNKGTVKYGSFAPEGLINNGLIVQPDVIASQIKAIFAANKLSKDRVICSINGLPFTYRLFTMPKMAPAAFNEAVIRAIRKEMPISPEEMYLYWQAYPTEKNEWQVLVAGITRQPVDTLIKTLRMAGIPPYYLDLQPLALARLTGENDAIIVEFEKDYSNIVILNEGIPQAVNIIPSLGLQSALEDEIRQITSRLMKMADFYNSSHPKKPLKDLVKVLVTGGLVNDAKVVELIRQEVAYPVELLTPAHKAIGNLPLHEYAANAGSLLMDVTPKQEAGKDVAPCRSLYLAKIALELQSVATSTISFKKILVPALLIGGLAALAFGFIMQNQAQSDIDQIQVQITQANTDFKQVQGQLNNAQSIQSQINQIEARIQNVNANYQLVLNSQNYVADIAAITKSMPEGIIYNSLEMNTKQISIHGRTINAAVVVQFARALETKGGFALADINWIDKSNSNAGYALAFLITINR